MKVMFVSLGCDKNLVDTENMLGILNDRGFTFTDDEMEAEVIAVNTCCFIHDAKQESINTILEMAEHKKDGKCKILIVTGCLAHRYQDEITKEIPEVDAFIGTSSYDKIADVIEAVLDGRTYNSIEDTDRLPLVRSKRVVTTGGYYEYLKIAEGCDKHCTYCIIPKIRGNYRSYPMDYLVEQAEALVANGAKELILVAQEMAAGAAAAAQSSLAVSVTGVAGPDPDEGNPVGLVYIGIAFEGSVYAARFQFTGSREEIRRQAACEALALALGVVSE